jgi:hypothetical protein
MSAAVKPGPSSHTASVTPSSWPAALTRIRPGPGRDAMACFTLFSTSV